MNNFFDCFIEDVISPKLPKVFTEYVTKKNRYKKHVFIEGHGDRNFYSTFLHKRLNVYPGEVGYLVCDGKKGVIDICNYFRTNYSLSVNDKAKYFIVDRDYDGLSGHECLMKDKMTVTKYYSFECYTFESENLKALFDYVDFDEADIELSSMLIDSFVNQILTYEAILSLSVKKRITKVFTKELSSYDISISDDEIIIDSRFDNDINDFVRKLSDKEKDWLDNEKMMLRKNYLYIRGHDLELITNMIFSYLGSDYSLSNLLSNDKFVDKLKISLDLK